MSTPEEQHGTPQPPEPASPKIGGQGDSLLADPGHVRADAIMLQRFPISPETRQIMVEKMREIVRGNPSPRNRIMATKTLAMLDKMNMEQERRNLGIPDTIVNVVQNVQQVNVTGQEVAMMHASISTPSQAALAAIGVKQNGNGSNGNGNGNGHTP